MHNQGQQRQRGDRVGATYLPNRIDGKAGQSNQGQITADSRFGKASGGVSSSFQRSRIGQGATAKLDGIANSPGADR